MTNLGRAGLLVAVAVSFAGFTAAGSASAATCSNTGCNNKDPMVTGCNTGAITLATAPITIQNKNNIGTNGTTIGTVAFRWSPTCKTNWARASVTVGTENVPIWDVGFVLNDGQKLKFTWVGRLQPGSTNWSDMLYAPTQLGYAWTELNPGYLPAGGTNYAYGKTVWAG